MKSNTIIFVILGLLLLGGLFFLIKPQTQNTSPTQIETENQPSPEMTLQPTTDPTKKTFEITIENKKITSGESSLQVTQGDEVTINISSDEAEEFHIHGYDNSIELEPGKQVKLTFSADISGRFPFELEHSATELGALEVQPK